MHWGRIFWNFIHAFAYHHARVLEPSRRIAPAEFRALMAALDASLPCSLCSSSIVAFMRSNEVTSQTDLFAWSVDLHNEINRKLGVHVVRQSLAEASWAQNADKKLVAYTLVMLQYVSCSATFQDPKSVEVLLVIETCVLHAFGPEHLPALQYLLRVKYAHKPLDLIRVLVDDLEFDVVQNQKFLRKAPMGASAPDNVPIRAVGSIDDASDSESESEDPVPKVQANQNASKPPTATVTDKDRDGKHDACEIKYTYKKVKYEDVVDGCSPLDLSDKSFSYNLIIPLKESIDVQAMTNKYDAIHDRLEDIVSRIGASTGERPFNLELEVVAFELDDAQALDIVTSPEVSERHVFRVHSISVCHDHELHSHSFIGDAAHVAYFEDGAPSYVHYNEETSVVVSMYVIVDAADLCGECECWMRRHVLAPIDRALSRAGIADPMYVSTSLTVCKYASADACRRWIECDDAMRDHIEVLATMLNIPHGYH